MFMNNSIIITQTTWNVLIQKKAEAVSILKNEQID